MQTYRLDYTRSHHQKREMLKPFVASGEVGCAHCGELILPGDEWDLGHSQDRRTSAPEHRRCNRATARRRLRHSRSW